MKQTGCYISSPLKRISSSKLLTTHHFLEINEDISVSYVLPLSMWLLSVNGGSTSPLLSESHYLSIALPSDQVSRLVLQHRLTFQRFQFLALV